MLRRVISATIHKPQPNAQIIGLTNSEGVGVEGLRNAAE